MKPTIYHRSPMFADVLSGVIPRPEEFQPGREDPVGWALKTPSLRHLPPGTEVLSWQQAARELVGALGDDGVLLVIIDAEGQPSLAALNPDGTRVAVVGLWAAAPLFGKG